jgi:putative ABC transport system ATP-binding protein
MIIRLSQVEPCPLQGNCRDSELWSQDVCLPSLSRVLVQAQSGKGKTSLLSALYGLRQDYYGGIFFDQISIRDLTLDQWTVIRRTRLAMVFQDLQLFDGLTARQNVEIKNQLTRSQSPSDITAMFETLGLSDKLDQPVAELSTGQKQRVAIIRALCQPFAWLLLDEPFSHLDAENTQRAFALISAACQKQGAGWILTCLAVPDFLASTLTYHL